MLKDLGTQWKDCADVLNDPQLLAMDDEHFPKRAGGITE